LKDIEEKISGLPQNVCEMCLVGIFIVRYSFFSGLYGK
jgi:hypothetical protein